MKIPYLAERVRLRGSDLVYFVTSVDEEQKTVNLLPVWGSKGSALDGVPFSDLVTTKSPPAKAK